MALKRLDHLASRHAFGLRENREVLLSHPRREMLNRSAERIVAGKEHKCVTIAPLNVTADHRRARPIVLLFVGRIGHAIERDQLGLLAVIEGAPQSQSRGLGQSDARLKKIKRSLAADRKRGARQDNRWHLFKQLFAQDGPNVDGRGGSANFGLPRRVNDRSIQYTESTICCFRQASISADST